MRLHHHLEDQPSKFRRKKKPSICCTEWFVSSNKIVKHTISNRLSLSLFFFNISPVKFFFSLSVSFDCLVAKLNYSYLDVEEKEKKKKKTREITTILFVFPSTPISSLFQSVLFLCFFLKNISRWTSGESSTQSNFFLFFIRWNWRRRKKSVDVVVYTYGEVAANSCYCCNVICTANKWIYLFYRKETLTTENTKDRKCMCDTNKLRF